MSAAGRGHQYADSRQASDSNSRIMENEENSEIITVSVVSKKDKSGRDISP